MIVIDAIVALLGGLAAYAWPALVLIIVILFRAELRTALNRLKNAKLPGGSEIAFDRILEEAEAAVILESASSSLMEANAGSENGPTATSRVLAAGSEPPTFDRLYLQELGKTSPSAAVMLAFRYIETELVKAVSDNGSMSMPVIKAITMLEQRGRIGPSDTMLLSEVRQLRNAVAHNGVDGLDYANVVRYLRLVEEVLARLMPRQVIIENNAVVGGQFPPNGPWQRSGRSVLPDGTYQIVRHGNGSWYLKTDPETVVFQPVFRRPA